ncbi:15051_t:CDS:2, partial [Gigaspora rosea]
MMLQEEIQNLSTLLAETAQKISALKAKYKNPSGLPIISKPKAGIILDNYRILHNTTISRVKPTLVNNWIDM